MNGAGVLREAAGHCRAGRELERGGIADLAEALLDGAVDNASKAEFLEALAQRGETPGELLAFAEAFLPRAVAPAVVETWQGVGLFDCCGTGGGGLSIVNVSTAVMFVVAAAGIPVVKHGNRGVTKASGSADVLEALGLRVEQDAEDMRRTLEAARVAFVFAPRHHPAFRTVAGVRRELGARGQRTIFNWLGPLLNPARPRFQMTGVFDPRLLEVYPFCLARLGRARHLAVYGEDAGGRALGEASDRGPTRVKGMLDGRDIDLRLEPAAGAGDYKPLEIRDAAESARVIGSVLEGARDVPARGIIVENAALALWTCGAAADAAEGRGRAEELLDNGAARRVLTHWRAVCPRL